jgi:uncharacterized membrane protein
MQDLKKHQDPTTGLTPTGAPLRLSFSLGAVMVITVVVAFMGTMLSQMFQAVVRPTPGNIGHFALLAAVGPCAILVIVGAVFKLWRAFKTYRLNALGDTDDTTQG